MLLWQHDQQTAPTALKKCQKSFKSQRLGNT